MAVKPIPKELAHHHGDERAALIGAEWARTFEEHGGLTGESRVLDIGCGPGRMASSIGERFNFSNPSYLGFDIVKADIDWCTQNITQEHPAFKFQQINIYNGHYNPAGTIRPDEVTFSMDDAGGDFIFATSVFTHMRTKEFLVYLDEIQRCLSPAGSVLATFFLIEDDFFGQMSGNRNFETALDAQCYTAMPDNPEDVIGYKREFVMNSFKSAGLEPTLYRGGWSKLLPRTGRHGQDYIVATKRR